MSGVISKAILHSLSEHGFVSQDKKSKKYKLGLSVMKYGFLMWDSLMLRSLARPIMAELSQKTKETVYLATRENREGVYIDAIDSPQILKISEPIGLRLPLYIGASNRAILAYLPQKVQEAILTNVNWDSIPSLIPLTKEYIQKDIEIIRSRGYAVTSGEATDGTTGIGAPIFSFDNTVIGSLNVAGPSIRFTPEKIEIFSQQAKKYTNMISKELGYRNRMKRSQ